MVSYKNSALKDILKARGVRGYSAKGKEDLLKMVMESGGLNIPLPEPKQVDVPQISDIKPPKKEKAPKTLKIKTDVKVGLHPSKG